MMKTDRIFKTLTAVLAVIILVPLAMAQPGTIVDIEISGFAFAPANPTVEIGTTVRWTNLDAMAHTTTSNTGLWDSGLLNQTDQFMHTFLATGTFPYHCTPHPAMTGTITVVATGATTNVNIPGLLFSPADITVEIGTVVKWTNNQVGMLHNTTSDDGVWASPNLSNGQSFSFLFTSTGAFPYKCTLHALTMLGTVTVVSTGASAAVDIPGLSFNPDHLMIPMNTVVTWTNNDAMNHTATSLDMFWDSDIIPPGGTFSHLFLTPGTFPYDCTLHPTMLGEIMVEFPAAPFMCGDFNDDNQVNILDIIFLINHKFKGGPAPDPLEAADVNNDGLVNILDIIYLIDFKFKGGPALNCP